MRVLVTGASSMVGSSLVRHLVENGFTPRVLLDPADEAHSLEGLELERVPGDILDPESVQSSLEGIQVVFHSDLACAYWPPLSAKARARNLDGTRNLLVAMVRAGVEDLIHVGSAFSFGPGSIDEPATEESPYAGGRFGLACLDSANAALELVLRYNDAGRLRGIVINPTLVLGTGVDPASPQAALIEFARSSKKWPSGGINVVGATDVAKASLKALGRAKPGRCYILGAVNLSYRELLEKLAAALGVPAPASPASDRSVMARGLVGSILGSLTRTRPTLTRELARLAVTPVYFESERASIELEFEAAPVDAAIEECCRGRRGP